MGIVQNCKLCLKPGFLTCLSHVYLYFRCNEVDMNKLHQEEMERAAEEAKNEYLRAHPEAAQVNLKYDPVKYIHTSQFFAAFTFCCNQHHYHHRLYPVFSPPSPLPPLSSTSPSYFFFLNHFSFLQLV